jgi:peroxiredoxin
VNSGIKALFSEFRDKGLIIIAVSTDRSPKKVKSYLERIPADFVVLHDNNKEAAALYGVYSIPTTFLIDHNGVIRHKLMGFRKWTDSGSKKLVEMLFK